MNKRPGVFPERSLGEKVWNALRQDLAPVWIEPESKRIDRLRRIVDELENYPWAADLPQEGNYVELVEDILRRLCKQAEEQQEGFDASIAEKREYRAALKIVGKYTDAEAVNKSAEMKLDLKTLGPFQWAEYHPLVSPKLGQVDYEQNAGRFPEWIKSNLSAALMNVLLVAGYDKGERDIYKTGKTKPLNKQTAAQLARDIAAQYGFKGTRKLSLDALKKAPLQF